MRITTIMSTAFAATVAMATVAQAGGFARGTADTDVLYEDGNFVLRSGVSYVSPTQNLNIGTPGSPGPAGTADITPDFVIPSFALKLQITDDMACAGTYTTPFGAHTDYSGTFLGFDTDSLASVSQEFTAHEFGATCSYKFDMSKGRFYLLGGVFVQQLDFTQKVLGNAAPGGTGTFPLNDTGYGFRVGAAYEIPEIALRAQLMYRSAVDVSASGTFTSIAPGPVITNPNAVGSATFPQSLELKVQSGIAPGWLAFGSLKWTDWSVFDTLNYNATGAPSALVFNWRDGWTVSGGIAHAFTEQLAGSVSLTWDRGVGTGFDLQGSDVWTVAVGGSYKPEKGVEFRAGLGVSFFEGAVQNFADAGGGVMVPFPGYKSTSSGHAIGGSVSAKVAF